MCLIQLTSFNKCGRIKSYNLYQITELGYRVEFKSRYSHCNIPSSLEDQDRKLLLLSNQAAKL